MSTVVVPRGSIAFNNSSGLAEPGGVLGRLTAALDNRAQYQGTLSGLAPALQASGVPVAQPQSILSQALSMFGLGGQAQPPTSPQMPTATSSQAGGSGAPAPTMTAPNLGGGGAPQPQTSAGQSGPSGFMPLFGNAIAGIESGGKYDAVGPDTGNGNRALGKYQVMASNVAPWTKELLGQELTPQQFLANPQAQEAVFNGKFGQYLSQTGNPRDAASMWFTGKPYAQGSGAQDQLGTSGAGYVQKFMAALPGGGSGAQGGGMPSQATAYTSGDSSGQMPRAPAVQALDGAAPMPIARSGPGAQQTPQPPRPAAFGGPGGAPAGDGSTAQSTPTSPGAVIGPLMSNPATRGAGAQAWQLYRQAAANGGGGGGLTLPAGMTPDALATMISTPETMQQGLGIWQRSLFPPITDHKPGDFIMRGNQVVGQVPQPLQHVVIGKNPYGEDIYGSFDPNSSHITPDALPSQGGPSQGAGAAPALATGPDASLPSGPSFLSTLPAPLRPQVQAIAEGRMKLPSGTSANSPLAQRLKSYVLQYDPTFDQTDTDARFETRKDFASGKTAQAINSGNTAVQHAADLSDAAEALGNSKYPIVNKIGQAIGNQTGNNIAGKEFQGALNDFADEVVRFYRNSGGTESDIDAVKSALDPSQSPDQLRAGIQQQARLIAGKTSSLNNQWHQGMGPLAQDYPVLSKETQGALARINARKPSVSSYPPRDAAGGGGQAPLPTASPAGTIPTLTDPSQVQALPPGSRFRTPDGQLRVRH